MSGIKDLAAKGRNGDNTLMHVSTDEVAGLNALAKGTMGRELTTNPETGLPEAFMFAPFLAPLAAGGLGVGGSALATGAIAGGLGAAEAELRGMDDPLKRGLFAGLTAGAASGIGNALTGAADAGTAATQVPTTGTPDIGQAVQGAGAAGAPGTGFSVANPPATGGGGSFAGAGDFTLTGQPAAVAPSPSISTMGQGSMYGGASLQAPGTGASISGTGAMAPTTTQPTSPLGQYADVPQMGEGLQNVFRDEGTRQQFMQDVRMPATAGAIGIGGQAQLNVQDEMKARKEASDRESAAELKEAQDRIRANYAAVGRPMPTGFGGGSLFADGGIVKLRRGGNVGGPGGGSDPGNRGGGRSSSSRGGGGGGGRSTHPGRPGGESGERSMTRGGGGGGGGGSSAAVQAPRQMDPAKIRAAVISPMDDLATGIGRLVSMSPTVRALQHLTRDRRGLGGAAPYGPGAPLTARERGEVPASARREGGGGDNNVPIIPQPAPAAEPTLPLMATPNPTPNEQAFLAQLQQGAGNRMAMQRSGYTGMAEGGEVQGYFFGGDIKGIVEKAKSLQGQPSGTANASQDDPRYKEFLAALQQGIGNRRAMEQSGYTGMASGGYLDGGMLPGDGMSDDVPATIDGNQPAALSSGEFVIPADVVSHIGNGSSDAGAKELYNMMDRIREARTGKDEQAPAINAKKMMPK